MTRPASMQISRSTTCTSTCTICSIQTRAALPVRGLTTPILITLEVAALATVPRKIAGPATAVAPSSLIISRRRHPVWQELVGLIDWVGEIQDAGGDRAPPVGTGAG